mgnify:CR=1 FL=1
MKKNFANVSWDTNDLFECKQAYRILRREYSEIELSTLDFGNLDTDAVEEEMINN